MRDARWLAVSAFLVGAYGWGCGNGGHGGPGAAAGDGGGGGGTNPVDPSASVLEHHHHPSRDGVYVDPALTKSAAAAMHIASSWSVTGPTYAAPLFVDGAVGGKDAVIVATEQNVVYAFDAASDATLWKTPALAPPLPLSAVQSQVGCGNIDPLGITGTPYIHLPSRTIYLDAMTTRDGGATAKHLAFALSLDDGSVRPGWPVDLEAALASAPSPFRSIVQNQRGAIAFVGGVVYIPFGGHYGDCGDYRGWLVGVDASTRAVTSWVTTASKGGAWAIAGAAYDGASLFLTTGNTDGAGGDPSRWQGGNAVVRLGLGPTFSGAAKDFFAPADWIALDQADLDLGGSAAVPIDLPGATPSALMIALGKNGKGYLLDRASFGGVGHELASAMVATNVINGAASVYATPAATYVAYRVQNGTGASCPNGAAGNVAAVKIGAASPPTITMAWCASRTDLAPPSVSVSSAAGADAIVWSTSKSGQLLGYDGETGAVVLGGATGGAGMTSVQYFQTPIVAKGAVYVAGNDHVYAWRP